MENTVSILTSSNGIPIIIILSIVIILLLFLGKFGLFSFNGKGLKIGLSENEVRSILLKQKEFLLQYCSCLTQMIISDLAVSGIKVDYVNTDYVVEKTVDEWLGWLLVNHINDSPEYVSLKTSQAEYIMLKAIGRVNPRLLQSIRLKEYFHNLCIRSTSEIIKGLLNVYKVEKRSL